MYLDLVVNSDNTKEIRPVNLKQLGSDSDIEITKAIPGTTDGVTTTIKQKKKTNKCSNKFFNIQNNYHSENYELNEGITEEHEYSNNDIEIDTLENVIGIDHHATVTASRKVYIIERY